ncbi:MerR family transcriptional regulator [Saccharospirillum sp. MSK14-1]|uniref:helix-turn-helix domain-containing protein n=1 Tax=Saccharospirillum sp. MSK14-1 TaxID=1897632 RepID=UPI000D39017C|nr:helix-turn-helix domain-containing protein [Saccharospirillum sp. MSK14-1]PTY37954.1 MerR family transcriptional regulator [Saccharospirillum sp. MSK14-1]
MDIGEVSQRSGLTVSTLRYYEEKGLIRSIGRNGLRRQFNANVVERLALIRLGRSAGLSLDDIAPMLGVPGTPNIDRQRLADQADQLDQTIKQLTAMRDGLRHAVNCQAPSYMECPSFQRLLKGATVTAVRQQKRTKPSTRRRG